MVEIENAGNAIQHLTIFIHLWDLFGSQTSTTSKNSGVIDCARSLLDRAKDQAKTSKKMDCEEAKTAMGDLVLFFPSAVTSPTFAFT